MIKFDLKRFLSITGLTVSDLVTKYGRTTQMYYAYKNKDDIGIKFAREIKKDFKLAYEKCLLDTIG